MARCGCATDCLCILSDGDCTAVVGSGTVTSPYMVNVVIDPDVLNQIECGNDGLFIEPTITVLDSDCIDLGGDGTVGDPLTADLILAPAAENLTICTASGLDTRLYTASTTCITLSGAGTIGDPLTADLVISPDPGNVLECRPTGAFAPAAAQGTVDRRATLLNTGSTPAILPPAAINVPSNVFMVWDSIRENVGMTIFAGPPVQIEVPIGGEGVYLIQATHPAWSLAPTNPGGDLIVRLRLWRWHSPYVGIAEGIGQSADVKFTTTATAFNTPYLHISRTIRLYDLDRLSVDFVAEDYNGAFAGAVLDTGPSYGANGGIEPPPAGLGLPFFQATKLGTP